MAARLVYQIATWVRHAETSGSHNRACLKAFAVTVHRSELGMRRCRMVAPVHRKNPGIRRCRRPDTSSRVRDHSSALSLNWLSLKWPPALPNLPFRHLPTSDRSNGRGPPGPAQTLAPTPRTRSLHTCSFWLPTCCGQAYFFGFSSAACATAQALNPAHQGQPAGACAVACAQGHHGAQTINLRGVGFPATRQPEKGNSRVSSSSPAGP